ncbi:type 1 glutamine amidotransferase [Granulicoccus sp. GXG6511]|uniref:type 1 glutamine amidotransferase n=1 Tax=Granulicoccus sp. GXG6511 TaxID=3381351 RepID=UPI003D7CE5D3
MAAPRIAIVQLDERAPLDRLSHCLAGAVLRNVSVWRRTLPPTQELGDGIIVLGGLASAHDPELWIQPIKRMMREAVDLDIPLLAICLGHQLLAEAFGGTTTVNDPGGGEHGPVEIEWLPASAGDPTLGRAAAAEASLFPGWHSDVVTRLPAGATELARSPAYPHQAFRIGSAVGVQFHPEASPELVTAWAEAGPGDAMLMRRTMRRVDASIFRNGALVGHGFMGAVKAHADREESGSEWVA